jgi:hypothetical protein
MPDGGNDRPFYRDPIKVVTLLSVGVATIAGIAGLYEKFLRKDPPASVVQYVVDVSHGMAGKVGHERKLAAVQDEILSRVEGEPDSAYSLRFAGPGCTRAYDGPRIGFDKDNADDFSSALEDLRPSGQSNFARSVRFAVADLNEQLDKGSKNVSMFFIVGGRDRCTKRPAAVIDQALGNLRGGREGTDINFKFVGVKVPEDMRRLLRHTRNKARRIGLHAQIAYADTARELGESLAPPEGDEPVSG